MKTSKYIGFILGTLCLIGVGLLGYLNVEVPELDIEETPVKDTIVPFQTYFEQYAPDIHWEWEMLAALCYEESHFNPNAGSAVGARGLMQLMPKTARRFGLNDTTITDPKESIRAGVEYITFLQKKYRFITDSAQNQMFVIASYNAGPAHIMDARRLAKANGDNPNIWYENTAYWLEQLQYDSIAADTANVKYGVFANPYEPIHYVDKVMRRYHIYKRKIAALQNKS